MVVLIPDESNVTVLVPEAAIFTPEWAVSVGAAAMTPSAHGMLLFSVSSTKDTNLNTANDPMYVSCNVDTEATCPDVW